MARPSIAYRFDFTHLKHRTSEYASGFTKDGTPRQSTMNVNILPQNAADRGATSDRFDRLFWKRLWRLIRPYWASERRLRALVLITAMTVLSLGTVGMQAIFSYVSRDVMNALQAKDAARFHHLLMLFVVWIVAFVPIAAFYPYFTGLLGIDWRDWMTESFVQKMLRRNALYHIMRDHYGR